MRDVNNYYVLICDDNPSYLYRIQGAIEQLNEMSDSYRLICKLAIGWEHFIEYIEKQVFDFIVLDTCMNDRASKSYDKMSEFQKAQYQLNLDYYGPDLYKYVQAYAPDATVFAVSNLPVSAMKRQFHNAGAFNLRFYNKKETDVDVLANYMRNYIETKKKRFLNNIFVVYGHNEEIHSEVVRYIRHFGINVINLQEHSEGGMGTVFSKLSSSALRAECAVVLYSGDDDSFDDHGNSTKRARQNVVFETGLFVGMLGRENVIVISEPQNESCLEWPSDIRGLHTIEFKRDGKWKGELRRQLDQIGFALSRRSS